MGLWSKSLRSLGVHGLRICRVSGCMFEGLVGVGAVGLKVEDLRFRAWFGGYGVDGRSRSGSETLSHNRGVNPS